MADDQTPKKLGRPPVVEPKSLPVTTWLPKSEYDKLCRLAHKRDEHLSAVVRSLLMLRLP